MQPSEQLYQLRLAARALALALDSLALGEVSVKFNADDPREVLFRPSQGQGETAVEVFFGENLPRQWNPLASVILDGATARVLIDDVTALVRTNHVSDFDPDELGIGTEIDLTIDLTDVIEQEGELLRTAPRRVAIARPSRVPEVRRALRWGSP